MDPSGDGAVDFDEFKQFINRRDKVGISQSREFCGTYDTSFKDQLLKLYDPKKVAPKFHPLYTLKALCKRESLKFDPSIRRHLNVLWKEIDEDKSGRIEYDEYVPMHRRCCEIMVSLTKIEVESISGKKVNVGTGLPPKLLTRDGRINHEEHEKLAQEDWEIDNCGMGFLDYERFASCWFQARTPCLSSCVGGAFMSTRERFRRRSRDAASRRWRAESGIARSGPPYAIDVSHAIDRTVHADRRPVHRQNSTRGVREVSREDRGTSSTGRGGEGTCS